MDPLQTRIFHRQLAVTPPVAVRGEGSWIIDAQGQRFLDACGGAAVSCLGHAHPEVRAALHAQVDRLAFAHTSFFTTDVAEELAAHLVAHAPAGLSHAYFLSGGSEAVEAALKMARQFHLERGEPERTRFIARRQSYHGNTLGALAIGGNAARRAPFAPLLSPAVHVAPCYPYRDQRPDESAQAYGARLADELEAAIVEAGPRHIIAFVAETVGGATAGVLTPVPGYLRAVREVCDRHGVLLILDEVMCGLGRTGTLHACEAEDVVPDLLVLAKGLGGGYQPIGAVLAHGRVVEAFRQGSGALQHGHTYVGHALACAAALAVQKVIVRDDLPARVRRQGEGLRARLQSRLGEHPNLGELRGRGLFWGLELVADRADRRPFDPSVRLHARLRQEAMARGLMVYPMGGTVDGQRGDHVVLAPSYLVTEDELDQIAERLGEALDAAVAGV